MKEALIPNFLAVRQHTEILCSYLQPEDYVIQGMEDVSPAKWHLAHTTWFFETFILKSYLVNYDVFHPSFEYLFNSYYQGVGNPFPREKRGLLSRPLTQEIYDYRHYVNNHIVNLWNDCSPIKQKQLENLIILGLEHEQQHQELLLMDIKYNFSINPTFPIYSPNQPKNHSENKISAQFITLPGGEAHIGYDGENFCFDNELPYHQAILIPFSMASKLVTNEEYLSFIEDGGYRKPEFWLADGWDWITTHKINHPLYWHYIEGFWHEFTLSGLKSLHLLEPVSHISFFEADAFSKWCECRLPTELEWEYFVDHAKLKIVHGNFMEQNRFHPEPARDDKQEIAYQFFGDLWEWTSSNYSPYPGYKPLKGILGEYNGKFMNNQRVLRGGSFATPYKHIRKSYRNYFQPDKRWQFCGIRLARDN